MERAVDDGGYAPKPPLKALHDGGYAPKPPLKAPSSWVRYLVVWVALLGLTALSFLLSLLHLGAVDVVAALAIAVVKTALVGLFFMHLVEERFSIVLAPLVAVFLFLLLLSFVVTDVVTRRTFPRAPSPNVDELPALSD